MQPTTNIVHLFQITSGITWTYTSGQVLRCGFSDQTFGMPLAALAANLSWEFIFSLVFPHETPQRYINITWF
jgi:hypothetical protein